MNTDTMLIQRLSRSELYSDYKKAFGDTTELPLTLRPLECLQLAHRHQTHETPFCTMMACSNRPCAACLEIQQRAAGGAIRGAATVRCFAGLFDTAIPIKLGERTIGFLLTGQVAVEEAPSEARFDLITHQLDQLQPHSKWLTSIRRYFRKPSTLESSAFWNSLRDTCLWWLIRSPCVRAKKNRRWSAEPGLISRAITRIR